MYQSFKIVKIAKDGKIYFHSAYLETRAQLNLLKKLEKINSHFSVVASWLDMTGFCDVINTC